MRQLVRGFENEYLTDLGAVVVALLCGIAVLLAFGIDHAGRLPSTVTTVEIEEEACEHCDDHDPNCPRLERLSDFDAYARAEAGL